MRRAVPVMKRERDTMSILFRCETLKDEAAYAYRRQFAFPSNTLHSARNRNLLGDDWHAKWRQTKKISASPSDCVLLIESLTHRFSFT